MAEKRLIDAVALEETLLNRFGCDLAYYGEDLQFCQDAVAFAPTVDAVEVVRCKDCETFSNGTCWKMRGKMKPEDFCSYGERKGENE